MSLRDYRKTTIKKPGSGPHGLQRWPERFWEKVFKYGPLPLNQPELGECWLWMGCRNERGYGYISYGKNQRLKRVHIVSWLLHFGEVPDNICVLHKCDNRACVRPSHLFVGTNQDNTDDMLRKGRGYNQLSNGRLEEAK